MTECTCEGKGNCSVCRANRKAEANADKPKKVNKPINRTPIKKKIVEKKPTDLEALKGKNVQLKGSKRVLSEEDIIAKQKEKERLKKEKDKAKRKAKRELITEAKLDLIFSKLVRSIYPFKCHSTGISLEGQTVNAAHFISRTVRSTRWDLRNVYPTLQSENFYNQLHILELSKCLKHYYLIDYDDFINQAKQTTCKLNATDRKEMFDIFTEAFTKVLELRGTYSKAINLETELEKLRLEVIKKTKKIM